MQAVAANLLGFLRKSPQFIIPIYQRTYSWTKPQCEQLWDDIIRTGSDDSISGHFIGSIVYIERGLYQISSQTPLLVIDGQQRLTTVSLIIEALARHLGDGEPIEGFSARKLRNYYLLNPDEEGKKRHKLLLTQTDEQTLLAIIGQAKLPEAGSLRVWGNFELFEEKVKELGENIGPLCKGLEKLMLVDISLDRAHDNPQLIFESMNSTGLELSQADLIRNYVLMGLEPDRQEKLYNDYWRPMEMAFGQDAYSKHFDGFMRHYLTIKTGTIPKIGRVYEEFKTYSQKKDHTLVNVDTLLADLNKFANYYCAIALGKEPEPDLAAAFRDIQDLKVDTAYPLMLEMYDDYRNDNDKLSLNDFTDAVRYIESYVFRRAVCSIPTNSLNNTFANFGRALKKDKYIESMLAHFLQMPSYRRFPNDEEFSREIQVKNLYNNRASYWLRRLENHDRKEPVPVEEYTVEHILPQNENLSKVWQDSLGEDWRNVQETWLHTLGNLTLTGYNAEYSDKPFAEKRDMKGGFKESPLRLNEGLRELDQWDENAIRDRAKRLANKAITVWKGPSLSKDTQHTYLPGSEVGTNAYTIEDHRYLAEGSHTRHIFEEFRREVLAIDPCVSEEFLKLYVAYKAETNFVDAVPQATRMSLTLNMGFHELHDPKGMARDVTGIGRWGNGDVEIPLANLEDLPYVTGLVRQAYEKQIGDEGS